MINKDGDRCTAVTYVVALLCKAVLIHVTRIFKKAQHTHFTGENVGIQKGHMFGATTVVEFEEVKTGRQVCLRTSSESLKNKQTCSHLINVFEVNSFKDNGCIEDLSNTGV